MALGLDTAALVAATTDHRLVGLTRTDISIHADVYTSRPLQVRVVMLAESCDATSLAVTERHYTHMLCACRLHDLRYRSEWGSLDLGRLGSHLGARGVQPMKRLLPRCAADERAAEGQGNSWLLRRPHTKAVCARSGSLTGH
jgi:hypothetical protein